MCFGEDFATSLSLSPRPKYRISFTQLNMEERPSTHSLLTSNTDSSRPSERVSMSQTPEKSTTSGFASVFKSLTGTKSSRSPNLQLHPAPQLDGANTLQPSIYGGPPDYEHLYTQLRVENPLADRISAAESLRLAVQDYPLTGVCMANSACGQSLHQFRSPAYSNRQRTSSTQPIQKMLERRDLNY